MGHKNAKLRRVEGRDRKTLTNQRQIRQLLTPNSAHAVIPHEAYFEYTANRDRLDEYLLGPDGLLKILPAAAYESIPPHFKALWCKEMGYHLLPTVELVDWLRKEIGAAAAIEICAGSGVLGRALGVPSIDWDVCARFPVAKMFYKIHAHEATPMIGAHCERIEAMEALAKYRPKVVFGGYITQRVYPGEPDTMPGSMYGVEERALIRCVERYIVISTRTTQCNKRIFRQVHREISPSWLITRHPDPTAPLISIWENDAPISVEAALRSTEAPVMVPHQAPITPPLAQLASQTTGQTAPLARMQR